MLQGVPPGLRSSEPKVSVQHPSAVALLHHSGRELTEAADAQHVLPPGHPKNHPGWALDQSPGWLTILLLYPFPARGLSSWSQNDCHLGFCCRDSSVLKPALQRRCGADFPWALSWG